MTAVCTVRVVVASFCIGASGRAAAAQPSSVPAPQSTATPQSRATPANDSDPCGGATRLLATLDRPTAGYSVCPVPRGALVLEAGYRNQVVAGRNGSATVTYPQALERVGIARNLELDLSGPNQNRMRSGSTVASGPSDFGLGLKYELGAAGRFTYALDALATAATGAVPFTSAAPTQTLDLDIAYQLSPAMGLATTLAQAAAAGIDADGNRVRYGAFSPSVVVTAQLPHALQFYLEVAGQTKAADGGGSVSTDFGLQKLLGPSVEIDAEYGTSFAPAQTRFHYIGFGTGVRVR